MSLLFATLLFAVLVVLISALRRRLVYELQGTSLLSFGSAKGGTYIFALLTFPGTVLHELSHWLMAEILQVRTGEMQILPDAESMGQGEEKLGFVMTGRTDPIRGFLIGFAPFITGITALVILGYLLDTFWGSAPTWQIALIIYGLIVVGNSMIVSKADSRNWPFMAIITALIVGALIRSKVVLPTGFLLSLTQIMVRIDQVLGLTILLNLAMIGGFYLLRRSVEKITKQKIVKKGRI
ncbi:MAG: putative membrane protein [Microgenomates group bacterium GW2011_GWF2_47_9]|nr:MAG: putative membrane protein [Microgenomates group bacterium GW2011_GWF2_47_9]